MKRLRLIWVALGIGIGSTMLWFSASGFWGLLTSGPAGVTTTFNSNPVQLANDITAKHPFGQIAPPVTKFGAPITNSVGDIVLKGVIASPSRTKGVAIVTVRDHPLSTVAEGADIRPGIRLIRVYSNRIEVEREGVRETVLLKSSSATAAPSQ